MIKEKILKREKIIGTHINFSDPSVGKIAGLCGYDFIWVDMEHSYLSFESLLSQIIAIKASGTDVIVRAPQHDKTAAKKIMEMGVDGIIFPMIRTAKEANDLISYTLYPPYGTRGFGPMNAVGYGAFDAMEYVATNHEKMCRFIQIEHIDAVRNLDEIMKNEFIDGYIIGPLDLSGSINELGNVTGENTTALIEEIVSRLKNNGKYVALSTGDVSEEGIRHWKEMGVDMLSTGSDYGFLTSSMRKNREVLTNVMKKEN